MPDKLIEVFAEELGVAASDLNDDSSMDTVEQWDSLAGMRLVVALETIFKVRLKAREIIKMRSIRIVRDVLRQKGADL